MLNVKSDKYEDILEAFVNYANDNFEGGRKFVYYGTSIYELLDNCPTIVLIMTLSYEGIDALMNIELPKSIFELRKRLEGMGLCTIPQQWNDASFGLLA